MAKVVGGLPPALDFMFGSFYRNFVSKKTLNHGIGAAINFTRASNATFFDADGTLKIAGTNVPRFDHSGGNSLGLLIEESRTNSIRNSQVGGAATGTPGTLPTNWSYVGMGALSSAVVGTGTESGLAYVDIRIFGTPSATGASIVFEALTQIVAASGQTWTHSVWLKLQGGSLTNVTNVRTFIRGNTAGGTVLETLGSASTPTASLIRYTHTGTLANASTARVQPYINLTLSIGAPIDFTLRIAAPQLEQGAFPTSYIPTTSAAATRAADSAVVTPISSFYNQVEGTVFAEYAGARGNRGVLQFNNNTNDERIGIITSDNSTPFLSAISGATSQAVIGVGLVPQIQDVIKFAGAFKRNDFQAARGGTLGVADTSGNMPAAQSTHCYIGSIALGGNNANCHIRKIAYWPKRLPDTLLRQLTT